MASDEDLLELERLNVAVEEAAAVLRDDPAYENLQKHNQVQAAFVALRSRLAEEALGGPGQGPQIIALDEGE